MVDGMGNDMVAGMMLSTGKCNQGRKNEVPQVDCLKVSEFSVLQVSAASLKVIWSHSRKPSSRKFSSHSSLYHQSPLIGSKQVHWFVHSFHNLNVQWKFTVLFFLYYSSSFGPGVLDDKYNLSVRILLSFDCLKFLKFAFKGWSVGIDWLLLFKGKCVKGQSWFGLIFLHFLISVTKVSKSF